MKETQRMAEEQKNATNATRCAWMRQVWPSLWSRPRAGPKSLWKLLRARVTPPGSNAVHLSRADQCVAIENGYSTQLQRRAPKSMWKSFPSRVIITLSLCRSPIPSTYVATQ